MAPSSAMTDQATPPPISAGTGHGRGEPNEGEQGA